MSKTKQKTRADLQRQVTELSAQLVHQYHFASAAIPKAGDALTGSAVILQLHALGGREIVAPVAIRGGLSADTIEALQRDLARSYSDAVAFKPKGVQ